MDCRTGKFSPHVEIPVRNVLDSAETLRTGLQTPSGTERYGRGCKPRPAPNVTDGVANPVRHRDNAIMINRRGVGDLSPTPWMVLLLDDN
jgi:hypothetical protein